MRRKPRTRTPEQFRAWLHANGITLKQFCLDNDIPRAAASDILRGRCVGNFGAVHRAAIAMGIKADPKEAA